jgi:hypothetical protein
MAMINSSFQKSNPSIKSKNERAAPNFVGLRRPALVSASQFHLLQAFAKAA